MRRFCTVAALGFLLAAKSIHAAPPVQGGDARQLVRTTLEALDGIAHAAREPKSGLDAKNPRHASFLAALAQLQVRVQTIAAALARGSEEFLGSVDLGSCDLGALRVAWARAGVSNPRMAEGIRIASASYRVLRATYGREGLRQRQGGGLSAAETRQLRRVRQAQQRFAESLRALRSEARRRGDRATAAELDRFHAEAERIAWASFNLESYLNALISAGELRGEWEADRPYIRKAVAPRKLAAADQAVEDLYVDSDISQVFTVNLGKAGEGDLEQATEVPGNDTVQVYQSDQSDQSGDEAEPAAPVETGGAVNAAAGDAEDGPVEGIEIAATSTEETEAQEPATEEVAEAPAVAPAPETLATPAAAKTQDPSKAPPSSPPDPPKPPPIG